MGLIPSDLDDEFESVETKSPVTDGITEGTVVAAEVRESRKPWIDAELNVKITADAGWTVFADIECSPLLDKQGNRSEGKLRFLKWQLNSLGYTGSLSHLESTLDSIIGNRIQFQVTTTTSDRVNPVSGKPYLDRDVVVKELIENVNAAPVAAVY